ncbi:MAG: helix-hairpin-helix domain-containing protein [Candidatus Krumholzibacteria bacterium]|nr:helix-hairpin-helix domain-containing protein [Candidatus Krumholzibacteria bacterium]
MSVTLRNGGAFHLRPRPVAGAFLVLALTLLPMFFGGFGYAQAADQQGRVEPMNLNSASLEEMLTLPIPQDLARRIHDYRTFVRPFANVYELNEIPGMTPEFFQILKPLVSVMPPDDEDPSIARLSASYRQVRRYLGQEGSSEGLVDEYLDKMRNPENINHMDLYDLMSYQNVSPVDATNILKARERLGNFESSRQMRRSDGLRYWAYRNLRDFVVYSEDEKISDSSRSVTGYIQTRYWETPYSNDDDEIGSITSGVPGSGRFLLDDLKLFQPGWMNKVRINVEGGYQAGFLTTREYGENNWDETVKGYVGVNDKQLGSFRLKAAYLGNFRVAYGLGLVMDNTDYIHFRKTGYGFNKRLLGIHGDLARSYEYHLTGGAIEGSMGPVNASLFISSDKKDGILNSDGTINRYVIMQPRPEGAWLDDRLAPGTGLPTGLRRNAFQEDMIGGNMKVMLAPGTFLGVLGYEARYNRGFVPDEKTLINGDDLDLLEARDTEITSAYNSVVHNDDGTVTEYRWRRVMGAEAQGVYKNVSIQGEYAFLQDPRNNFFSGKNPDAYIINAYSQWENLHLLAIYRNYDVGFDNPYGRAFSNDSKYEMTLLSSPFRLNDGLYSWLETTTPQPKAEQGLFLEMRYRISRKLILSGLQFDQWTRKADGAELMRYTIKGEYQPLFNLRFRVRHRYSSRSESDPFDTRRFQNWETRWQMIALMSNYNRLAFMYMTSNVMFPPRQRWPFAGTPEPGGQSAVGTNGAPGHAFEVRYEHNLTPGIQLSFASSMYDGFFWNFEGNEFVLLDGTGFRNWFKVETRVSQRLLFQLKVTRDHNLPKTYVDIRNFGDNLGNTPDATYVPKDDTLVRLQMDYTF